MNLFKTKKLPGGRDSARRLLRRRPFYRGRLGQLRCHLFKNMFWRDEDDEDPEIAIWMWRKGYQGFDPGPFSWDIISILWTQVWTLRFRPGQHQNFDDCHLCWFACCQMSPRAEQKYQWHHHPPGVQGMSHRMGFGSPSLKKVMGLRTISGFWCFCEPNPRCVIKRVMLCRLPHGLADATTFPWNWPVAAAGSGKPVLEVRPEGMILVCKAPRSPHGSNTVHQFPSVWFPRVILVLCFLLWLWCFLLPPADDFSQLRLPGALETPCKTSCRRSPRLKEMRERAAAAAPVTPRVVKVEVPQSLGQAVLALSGVELQAQLSVRDLMRTDVFWGEL